MLGTTGQPSDSHPASVAAADDSADESPVEAPPDVQACRTCGATDVPLHFDSVAPPERVSDLVVRDRGRCISCVVHGR
ncbi:hypothetical protein [Kitasatospora sp. HPMI-4]|uniref:hypothetical protein n=1 Tax=Kitasatospora sp. HPMI-4 TaxID=3448443 RepID=UPI003F1A0134